MELIAINRRLYGTKMNSVQSQTIKPLNQVIILREGMARKYFEQMLINELELGKATSFPRWYAAPSPLYYGLYNMNQDFRNVSRVNRHDLYSMEYYRQPFWMPQALVFPNYEQVCFLRRNNKRYSNGRNNFSRDKRSNGEKKFYGQEDVHNCRDAEKTDFQPHFERRYPEGWNGDRQRYQIPRDDRNSSSIAYRNSNFGFGSENLMIEQQLHNIKQMLDNRNQSSDSLTVNGNLPQTEYSINEGSMQADFQSNSYKTLDTDWQDQTDKASKNNNCSQYSELQNFSNNESWFCPEEQQQIVDMLKEVNLRHERQLKSDMLLYNSDQPYSNDLLSTTNESQTSESLQKSLSSEEDEDNINILLYPGGVPPIAEEVGDEEPKSKCNEKAATNVLEEFQKIFTSSPEKKIINELIKEKAKKSETVEDDDLENIGRVITEDDKNAVKTVLDFDHMDDLTEKLFDKGTFASSTPKVTASHVLENEMLITIDNKKQTSFQEKCNLSGENDDFKMVSGSGCDSLSLFNISSYSNSCSEIVELDNKSLLASSKQSSRNPNLNKYPQASNSEHSEIFSINNSSNLSQYVNADPYVISPSNNRDFFKEIHKKNKKDKKIIKEIAIVHSNQMSISEKAYDKNKMKENLYKERTENQCNSYASAPRSSSTLNKAKVSIGNSINESNNLKNITKINYTDETHISKRNTENDLETLNNHSISDKPSRKKEFGLSVSDPYLSPKKAHVGYKRISISEIFSYGNAKSENEYQNLSNNRHTAHLVDLNMHVKDLSPSDHLKLILGIGQNHGSNRSACPNTLNDSADNETLNKFQSKMPVQNDSTKMPKTNALSKYSEVISSPLKQDLTKSSCYKSIDNSIQKDNTVKKKHSITQPEDINSDVYVNNKSTDKNKKIVTYSSSSTDFKRADNTTEEANLNKNDHDPVAKHKKKQKRKKANQRKESFSEKEMSLCSAEQNTGQECFSESSTIKISEKRSKFNQNVTSAVWIKTHEPFHEPEKKNEYSHSENLTKKSKRELSKYFNSKYCSQKMSIKDTDVSVDADGSYVPVNRERNPGETPVAINGKRFSSNIRKMNYPDWKMSIINKESVVDHSCSPFSLRTDKYANKLLSGMRYKNNYRETQVTNSKNFHQHRGSKSNDSCTGPNELSLSESNEKEKELASMKFNYPKTQIDDSNYSLDATSIKENGSYSGKARKKNKIKQNEKLADNCDNLSETGPNIVKKISDNLSETVKHIEKKTSNKIGYSLKEACYTHNQSERSNTVTTKDNLQEDLKKTANEINLDDNSSNSKSNPNNFNQNTPIEKKHKYLEKFNTDDFIAPFNNNALVCVLDTHRPTCNKHSVKTGEKILCFVSKNCRLEDDKSVFSMKDNIVQKAEKSPKSITHLKSVKFIQKSPFSSETKIQSSLHTSLQERSRETGRYLENKSYNNSELSRRISYEKEENLLENPNCFTSMNRTSMRQFSSESSPNNMFHDEVRQYSETEQYYKTKKYNSDELSTSSERKNKAFAFNEIHQQREDKKYNYLNKDFVNNKVKAAINSCKNEWKVRDVISTSEAIRLKTNSNTKSRKGLPKQQTKTTNISLKDKSLMSLKTENACILKKFHEIKFADFLKCYFIEPDYPKTENKEPKLLNSSRSFKTQCSLKQEADSNKNFILTVTPDVMYWCMKNKQAMKMNPSLDIQVDSFLADFFCEYEFLKFNPELKSSIVLSLHRIIEENLLHALPLLLNALSLLSAIYMPWNHDNLKKMVEMNRPTKHQFSVSLNKEMMSQTSANEVLKYWDIVLSCITKRTIRNI